MEMCFTKGIIIDMVFSSLFFVLFFLPLNLLLYIFMPNIKAKNMEMLIFSLIF